jgi:hypothetical protein
MVFPAAFFFFTKLLLFIVRFFLSLTVRLTVCYFSFGEKWVFNMKSSSERIEEFFFEAMKQGWAAPVQKLPIPGLPGSKSIPFTSGEYSLLDYYFVAPDSDVSYGTTAIWVADKPVWIMHYGGWYNKQVIPFLKRALMRNYSCNVFLGGRGPERLEGEDHTLQYINNVEQSDFGNFRGHECIISTSHNTGLLPGSKFGDHHYFGGFF